MVKRSFGKSLPSAFYRSPMHARLPYFRSVAGKRTWRVAKRLSVPCAIGDVREELVLLDESVPRRLRSVSVLIATVVKKTGSVHRVEGKVRYFRRDRAVSRHIPESVVPIRDISFGIPSAVCTGFADVRIVAFELAISDPFDCFGLLFSVIPIVGGMSCRKRKSF